MKLKTNLGADGAIVLTTLVWGSTFVISRDILDRWPPLPYLALRLPLAALALALLFPRHLFGATRDAWKAGATLGLLIGLGFLGQTTGLLYTTPAKSAFITGITTPLVPVVSYVLFRARPSRENLAGIVLASAGGALILAPAGAAGVNTGDLLTLCMTLLFATHISLMSAYARRFDARQLSAIQIVVAASVAVAAWSLLRAYASLAGVWTLSPGLAREAEFLTFDTRAAWQLAYMVVVATVGVFLLWTWGQARMSATHAAVIFSLEPIFATAFAVILRGSAEWAGGRATVGAILVLAGVLVSELRWGRRAEKSVVDDSGENGPSGSAE
jgi:drug/metabolite transporter (DMT)-like permease